MPRVAHRAVVFVCLVFAASRAVAAAPEFVPPELYRYETLTFANGFRAVLNPRHGSRNVSFRLVVDVGLLDFECRDRELPHLAEHLMFSGPGELTESDLDAMVYALGGEWNAYTDSFKTEYQLDIYSGHALEGLEILHRMFTETEVTEGRLASARGVVHAESGGEPGVVRDLLQRWGFGDGGVAESYLRFVPKSRAFCIQVPVTDHLGVAELAAFMRLYYQPPGMLLIAVGDFDPRELKAALAAGFGAIPATAVARPPRVRPALAAQPAHYRTTLNPMLGNTTQVTIDLMVDSPQPFSADMFALQQLADYLDSRLYEEVRVNRGLAYTPMVTLVDQGDFMTLMFEAEVDPSRSDAVLQIMQDLIAEVVTDGIDPETLAAQREGTAYRLAAILDSNASFSDTYVDVSERLSRGETVPDIEAAISAYDADALRARAAAWFSMDRALIYEAAPTLSYGAFGWLLALLAVTLAWRAGYLLMRHRRAAGRT